jgi:poly-gamma-glutamate capsule biosynthesis protein CapA/YwtB (metallophosphatase superfamily)
VKVAFLAFADYSNNTNLTPYGVNIYHKDELVRKLVGEASANADAVVVSAHWGTEDSSTVNDDQTMAAQLFADSGADVVIGTGPHVIQEAKYITSSDGRKTLVWYSIGNMLSSQLQVNELTGVVVGFTLRKQPQSGVRVERPTAQITYMSYDWSTGDKAAGRLSARSNLRLRSLSQSGTAVRDMFGQAYSIGEREAYVKSVLGTETGVEVRP